jgi:hypothetical protein
MFTCGINSGAGVNNNGGYTFHQIYFVRGNTGGKFATGCQRRRWHVATGGKTLLVNKDIS